MLQLNKLRHHILARQKGKRRLRSAFSRSHRIRSCASTTAPKWTGSTRQPDRPETAACHRLSYPQRYPQGIAASLRGHAFDCWPPQPRYHDFRSIEFGPPKRERSPSADGRCAGTLPVSRQANLILVPAAVAATENVTGRACASSPLMFFGDSFPSTDVTVRSAAKASCRSDCVASASD